MLRPGGRAAFIAWGPYAGNPFWTAFWNVQERYAAEVAAASPAPDGGAEPDDRAKAREAVDTDGAEPAAPDPRGPFRFAEEGSLLGALRAAGFADAREEVLRVALPASSPDPLAAFWLTDDATLNALPAARQADFREEVVAAYRAFADGDGDGDGILVPAVFVLGSGAAP